VIIGVIDFARNIADAIAFPRIHNQLIPETVTLSLRPSHHCVRCWCYWNKQTYAERDYPTDIIKELLQRNHTIEFRDPMSVVQGIVVGEFDFDSSRWIHPSILMRCVLQAKMDCCTLRATGESEGYQLDIKERAEPVVWRFNWRRAGDVT